MSGMKDLFGDEPYPQSPGFQDLGTSFDAAKAVEPSASDVREQCYEMLAKSADGFTADQVAARLGRPILYIRPRLSELYAAGRIVKTSRRRLNKSGLSAAVYDVERSLRYEP